MSMYVTHDASNFVTLTRTQPPVDVDVTCTDESIIKDLQHKQTAGNAASDNKFTTVRLKKHCTSCTLAYRAVAERCRSSFADIPDSVAYDVGASQHRQMNTYTDHE